MKLIDYELQNNILRDPNYLKEEKFSTFQWLLLRYGNDIAHSLSIMAEEVTISLNKRKIDIAATKRLYEFHELRDLEEETPPE